jgi:glycosyltransferase involved in cell wall biosynthesis
MTRKRIAYINHSLVVPMNRDRVERFNQGHDYEQIGIAPTRWNDRDNARCYRNSRPANGVRFVRKLGPSVPVKHGYELISLLKLLRDIDPVLVHAELEPYSVGGWQMTAISRLLSVPLVLSTWQNSLSTTRIRLSRPIARACAALVAGTEQIAGVWSSLRGDIDVIPLGFDSDQFQPPAHDPRPVVPGRVGFLGRLVHGKGVDILLRAAAHGGDWSLLIDDGPGRGPLEELAGELGIAPRVSFCSLDYEAVPDFLGGIDILVLPSRTTSSWREQFGRVLIEAMATGTPVIGSSSGSIPSVIDSAGLVFPEGDHGALAANIERLLGDRDLWLDLRRRGLARAAGYTWESVAERTAAVYERVIGGG